MPGADVWRLSRVGALGGGGGRTGAVLTPIVVYYLVVAHRRLMSNDFHHLLHIVKDKFHYAICIEPAPNQLA